MRCWVPLLATLSFGLVFAGFMMRSGGSSYNFFRMDVWGDGYCGPNASRWEYSVGPAPVTADGSTDSATNSSSPAPPPYLSAVADAGAIDNKGCTGGVPQGFMPRRMMVDMLGVGLIGPLLMIEVSGRCLLYTSPSPRD